LPKSTATALASGTEDDDLIRRFSSDLSFYGRVCLRIEDKDTDLVPFTLNQAQRLVHERIGEQLRRTGRVRALVLKARQLGISTYVAARFFRRLHLDRRVRGLVVADQEDRAGDIFAIYGRFRDQLPEDAEIRPISVVDQHRQRLEFTHGSKLGVGTAKNPKTGRGKTLQLLHISEYAFWDHPLVTMTALMQSLAPRSEVIIESTANGVGNDFHQLWLGATAGENEWIAIFLPWWIDEGYALPLTKDQHAEVIATADDWERDALDTGIEWEGQRHRLQPEQIAWRRLKVSTDLAGDERAFRQEYPSTAEEAFLVSGGAFFDTDKLTELAANTTKPQVRGTIDGTKAIRLNRSERGWLRIWEMPEVGGHYVIGADTAEGKQVAARATLDEAEAERGGRDFDSADVLRVDGRTRIVAQLHGRMAPEVFAEQLFGLGTLFSCPTGRGNVRERALLAVERNHHSGITTIERLRKLGYDQLFVARPVAARKEKPQDRIGWITSGETRRPMLDQLAERIRGGTLGVRSSDTVREMLTFIYDPKDGEPRAQDGTHDDRVISLGIACQMQGFHRHAAPEPEPLDGDYLPPMPDQTGY